VSAIVPDPPVLSFDLGVTARFDGFAWRAKSRLRVEADGAPCAYAPRDSGLVTLDDLSSAGEPGNWYGIATDTDRGDGEPLIQQAGDPAPGYYISKTKYRDKTKLWRDQTAYPDATEVPYISVPPEMLLAGVQMGDVGVVLRKTKGVTLWTPVVVADVGPHRKFGEASIATAAKLGLPVSARNGGVDDLVICYSIWPLTSRPWPRSPEDIAEQVSGILLSNGLAACNF